MARDLIGSCSKQSHQKEVVKASDQSQRSSFHQVGAGAGTAGAGMAGPSREAASACGLNRCRSRSCSCLLQVSKQNSGRKAVALSSVFSSSPSSSGQVRFNGLHAPHMPTLCFIACPHALNQPILFVSSSAWHTNKQYGISHSTFKAVGPGALGPNTLPLARETPQLPYLQPPLTPTIAFFLLRTSVIL